MSREVMIISLVALQFIVVVAWLVWLKRLERKSRADAENAQREYEKTMESYMNLIRNIVIKEVKND